MAKILKVKNVGDYSRYLGVVERPPLACFIDYKKVSHVHSSLLRLVGFPSSLRLGLRIPPTLLPHVQKTRRHHPIAVLPQPAQLMTRIDVGSWLRAYLVKDTPPPCVYSPKQQIIYCCAGLFAYCSRLANLPKYLQICRLPPLFSMQYL